jgi:hypothetical protein
LAEKKEVGSSMEMVVWIVSWVEAFMAGLPKWLALAEEGPSMVGS